MKIVLIYFINEWIWLSCVFGCILGFFGWGKLGRVVNCGFWFVFVLLVDNGFIGDRILIIVLICSLLSFLVIVIYDECDCRIRF